MVKFIIPEYTFPCEDQAQASKVLEELQGPIFVGSVGFAPAHKHGVVWEKGFLISDEALRLTQEEEQELERLRAENEYLLKLLEEMRLTDKMLAKRLLEGLGIKKPDSLELD